MQEKLLLFFIKMENACIYKGVLELSLALLFSALHADPPTHLLTSKMRSQNLFYLRGSSSASLQVYLPYSITINGCLVQRLDIDLTHTHIRFLSYLQPVQRHGFYGSPAYTLNYIQFKFQMRLCLSFSVRFEFAGVAGWLADVERRSCIIYMKELAYILITN
jgi:hypothetical protein